MLHRIWNLVVKEFIQLFRDRLLAPFVLLGPLTELLMVAWSTAQGIDHLPTAVLDLDRTVASRGDSHPGHQHSQCAANGEGCLRPFPAALS